MSRDSMLRIINKQQHTRRIEMAWKRDGRVVINGEFRFKQNHRPKPVKQIECIICKATELGMGHNPEPVISRAHGRVCSDCNARIIVPARINMETLRLKAYSKALEVAGEHSGR